MPLLRALKRRKLAVEFSATSDTGGVAFGHASKSHRVTVSDLLVAYRDGKLSADDAALAVADRVAGNG